MRVQAAAIVSLLTAIVSGQKCDSTKSAGQCLNGKCPIPGDVCVRDMCCHPSVVVPTTECADSVNETTGVSDCPGMATVCKHPIYIELMTQRCPQTCGLCSSSPTTTTQLAPKKDCVDLINAQTGVSDCPGAANLCNLQAYYTFMTQNCPRTCGRC